MFLWKVPRDLVRYHEHGYRKGNLPHQDFEFDIFLLNFSRKMFSYKFEVGKMKFHHCWTPWTNVLFSPPGKNPSDGRDHEYGP